MLQIMERNVGGHDQRLLTAIPAVNHVVNLLQSALRPTVNATRKMSFFAGMECHLLAVSMQWVCNLDYPLLVVFARQVLIYQGILDLTGENDKYNHSEVAHLYPPCYYIPRSAKNYKIPPALTKKAAE